MAFTLAEAVVYISGDDSQLDRDLPKSKKKVGTFVAGTAKALGGVAVGAAAAAGAAVLGVGTAAAKVSNQTAEAAAQMAASLGIPIDEANRFADVARDVYGNNFAGSVQEAGEAITGIVQQLGLAADDPSLPTIAENAFMLQDVFGTDVNDAISTVKTLMENFGLSSDEAFDLIASGYQKGLDRSGDFLDSINEYSPQFSNAGADADQFFSLLDSGLQGGVLGTDKAADAFKEFGIRIIDGSKTTSEGLEGIGLSAEDMQEAISSGQMTVADAFQTVIERLNATEDPIARNQAGVALMGTQYEDLTDSLATNLDLTQDWASTSEGAIGTLNTKYTTFGSAVEAIWRRLVTAISPFTDKLLEIVNDAMPHIMAAFDKFEQDVIPAIQAVFDAVTGFVDWLKQKWQEARESTEETTGTLQYLRDWFDENMPRIRAIVEKVINAVNAFWQAHGDKIMWVVDTVLVNFMRAFDVFFKNLLDLVSFWLAVLSGDWEGAADSLEQIWDRTWTAIMDTLKNIFGPAVEWVRAKFQEIMTKIGEVLSPSALAQMGRDMVQGFIDGIGDRIEAVKAKVTELYNAAVEAAKNALGISSPSKVFAAMGKNISLTFIENMTKALLKAQNVIVGAFQDLIKTIQAEINKLMAQSSPMASLAQQSMTNVKKMGQEIKQALPTADLKLFHKIVNDGIEGINAYLDQGTDAVGLFKFVGKINKHLRAFQGKGVPADIIHQAGKLIPDSTNNAFSLAEDFSLVPAKFYGKQPINNFNLHVTSSGDTLADIESRLQLYQMIYG